MGTSEERRLPKMAVLRSHLVEVPAGFRHAGNVAFLFFLFFFLVSYFVFLMEVRGSAVKCLRCVFSLAEASPMAGRTLDLRDS